MIHLREALARVLTERVEFPRGIFVTVLEVKMTRNQTQAKVVLSVLPVDQEETVLKTLNDKDTAHEIKDGLANAVRLRHIPRLHWTFDETEAAAADIDATINELKAKGEL